MARLAFLSWLVLAGTLASLLAAEPVKPERTKVQADIQQALALEYAKLEAFYKDVHQHPELSLQEQRTAEKLAKELKELGCEVTEKVGATGVVGVFKNGVGPTVLVRADMDALPVEEMTGLPYASKVKTRDKAGNEVSVMHACGHDVNVTCLVGTARQLVRLKDRWQGTLIFIGQPAEEIGTGARLMLEAGLFKRFPKPDYCLALHCDGRFAHGDVNYRIGQCQANVDSVDVILKGKGGHGAAPHTTVDPIVLAAKFVLDLQTIVSRETNPIQPAVVTVGSIHGGTKHNIISNEVKLQLTVRTLNDVSRKEVLDAITRKAKAAALSANAPEPSVHVDPGEFTPALFNDEKLSRRLVGVLEKVLGKEHVLERPMSMGGEDFSRFGREGVPTFYYWLGTQPRDKVIAAQRPGAMPLPPTHSGWFYPVPEPTIKTGVLSMSMVVLDLLGK